MSIQMASDIADVKVIPTGLFIDRLSGKGGIPLGRITEVFGDSGVGKSTLLLQAVAAAQKLGLTCCWADVEWSFDPVYATALDVDVTKLAVIREQFAEDTLNTIEKEVSKGNFDLVILDSVGGLLPRPEAEKQAGEKTIGAQAGLFAPFLRRIVPYLHMKQTALVVINHSFVDIMSGAIKSSGGKKLEFHRSLCIRLKQKPNVSIKVGDKKVGMVLVGIVKRNKIAGTEGMELDAQFLYEGGFQASLDLLQDAIDKGVIVKRGNTYYFTTDGDALIGGEKLGFISKVREWMKDEANVERVKAAMV